MRSHIPPNVRAFLASNLDESGHAVREAANAHTPLAGKTVLIVPTATYAEDRALNPEKARPYWDLGAAVAVLDIARCTFAELATALHRADALHVCGGNTFALVAAARACNLQAALAWRAESGPFSVIGESAGALLFGPDVAHAASLDDPSRGDGTTAGLGWFGDLLVPHVDSPYWGMGEAVNAWLAAQTNPERYLPMHDGQFLEVGPEGPALHTPVAKARGPIPDPRDARLAELEARLAERGAG